MMPMGYILPSEIVVFGSSSVIGRLFVVQEGPMLLEGFSKPLIVFVRHFAPYRDAGVLTSSSLDKPERLLRPAANALAIWAATRTYPCRTASSAHSHSVLKNRDEHLTTAPVPESTQRHCQGFVPRPSEMKLQSMVPSCEGLTGRAMTGLDALSCWRRTSKAEALGSHIADRQTS